MEGVGVKGMERNAGTGEAGWWSVQCCLWEPGPHADAVGRDAGLGVCSPFTPARPSCPPGLHALRALPPFTPPRYNHDSRPNPYDRGVLLNCAEVWCSPVPPPKVPFRAYVDEFKPPSEF